MDLGVDEPRSEGEAMAEYARELGAPSERMLVASASTTTEANLALSRTLLAESGVRGPVLAVSNDYHAFRAATLLRKLGIDGHAIGARTARYYLPSALLREFIALLRDHRVLNVTALCHRDDGSVQRCGLRLRRGSRCGAAVMYQASHRPPTPLLQATALMGRYP